MRRCNTTSQMSLMRQLSLPKLRTSDHQREQAGSSCSSSMSKHSRDCSAASSASSPSTPSLGRSHNRWPSSSSSLVPNPDSPVLSSKSALHDLVEDPAERDEISSFALPDATIEEPLCICDTPFCEHRRAMNSTVPSSSPEWSPGDESFGDGFFATERSHKRRKSGEISLDSLTSNLGSRLSRRFPSISRKWQGHRTSASFTESTVRSAPLSRSSSFRQPSSRRSTITRSPIEPVDIAHLSFLSHENEERGRAPRRASATAAGHALHIRMPTPESQSADRPEPVSTPLLPPMMDKQFNDSVEEVQSPLPSPTVAQWNLSDSVLEQRSSLAQSPGMPTPPLSTKNSIASIPRRRSGHPTAEIPPLSISGDYDPWADKLGHANFHIQPEPYTPEVCDSQSCRKLLDDWESARRQYMRQAAGISQNYGPTSQTYHFAQEKWTQIDARWRSIHEWANAEAEASGDSPLFQSLAHTQAVPEMPTLDVNDPQSKFPAMREDEMVGPMVQYAKPQRRPSKRPNLLRIFTDPGSVLSGFRR